MKARRFPPREYAPRNEKTLQLLEEFFSDSGFHFQPDLEGQWVDEDGRVLLGDRSGPEYNSTSALCHEMAHAVEIDDARLRRSGWGLRVRQTVIMERSYDQPLTYEATQRELRVCAFQANLEAHLGLPPEEMQATVWSLRFLSDSCNVPEATVADPAIPGHMGSFTAKRITWCWEQFLVLRTQPQFQLDCFRAEWQRKSRLLKDLS